MVACFVCTSDTTFLNNPVFQRWDWNWPQNWTFLYEMINLVKLQLYQRNPTASNGRINTRIWSSHILHSGLQFTVLSFGIFVVTHCILRFVSARIQANDDTISLTSLGFLFRYYIIIFFFAISCFNVRPLTVLLLFVRQRGRWSNLSNIRPCDQFSCEEIFESL